MKSKVRTRRLRNKKTEGKLIDSDRCGVEVPFYRNQLSGPSIMGSWTKMCFYIYAFLALYIAVNCLCYLLI